MLKKYYDRIDKENMDKIVNTISMTVHQSDELLTNLLEWARAQTDSLKFEPQILNLLPIILDVMPIIKGSAFPKNIKVDTNVDHDLTVFADLNMLNTILRNIVSNAIKFTPRDGSIIITAENENDKIKLTVTDNGVGIEPENLQKLFRIETKFKTKGTDNESGTGLGLILCKEFIEKHNGKIWAESEFGKGTKFIFTLPKTLI
jgi:signal transduction histidine kinase